MIWIIGKCAARASFWIPSFLETLEEDDPAVQLQLLTDAVMSFTANLEVKAIKRQRNCFSSFPSPYVVMTERPPLSKRSSPPTSFSVFFFLFFIVVIVLFFFHTNSSSWFTNHKVS